MLQTTHLKGWTSSLSFQEWQSISRWSSRAGFSRWLPPSIQCNTLLCMALSSYETGSSLSDTICNDPTVKPSRLLMMGPPHSMILSALSWSPHGFLFSIPKGLIQSGGLHIYYSPQPFFTDVGCYKLPTLRAQRPHRAFRSDNRSRDHPVVQDSRGGSHSPYSVTLCPAWHLILTGLDHSALIPFVTTRLWTAKITHDGPTTQYDIVGFEPNSARICV